MPAWMARVGGSWVGGEPMNMAEGITTTRRTSTRPSSSCAMGGVAGVGSAEDGDDKESMMMNRVC